VPCDTEDELLVWELLELPLLPKRLKVWLVELLLRVGDEELEPNRWNVVWLLLVERGVLVVVRRTITGDDPPDDGGTPSTGRSPVGCVAAASARSTSTFSTIADGAAAASVESSSGCSRQLRKPVSAATDPIKKSEIPLVRFIPALFPAVRTRRRS
jgi:hypothetical protein